eukprot:TRINITY_DN8139_c0_g1_i1.p1 TRINITY_DN8139_c0_g1~~TRINITY_DN8139_c0_g1_i1.p1  ORF type:complete len:318 (-),score=52.25 TRINITY_DN8139_c0_g1_i1:303-1256(-)
MVDFKLAFLVVGIWVSFTAFGWAQEAITKTKYEGGDRFHNHSVLVLLQSVSNSLVALAILFASHGPRVALRGGVPAKDWLIAAGAYFGAHTCGLWALSYINFPLQVLVKSCKPIPVLLGEVIVARQRHNAQKYISVVLLSLGIAVFFLGAPSGKSSNGESEYAWTAELGIGIALVLVSLFFDGVYGPYQNRIVHRFRPSSYHLMLNMNLFQALIALFPVLFKGEVQEALSFCHRHPDMVPKFVWFAATMALGNVFIYNLQHSYGALTVTKTTTIRKLASIVFSVVWFGHVMTPVQWLGVACVTASEPASHPIARLLA